MKFLIPTEPDDIHAVLVKLALEKKGHHVRLLFTADAPTRQRNSVFIDNDRYQWHSHDDYHSDCNNDYDVVWWRRARKPHLPKETAHPDDYGFVLRENALFHESVTSNMAPYAWWVNTKESAAKANYKLLQLKTAVDCGFIIPRTLCSNNPRDIRYFLLKHEKEGVIYKPLCSGFWFENNQLKVAYTSKVTFSDLPCNRLLQLSPGIFQKQVPKNYELRVTCFGDYILSVKLLSQDHADGLIDWRVIPPKEMSIEPYKLSRRMENKIRMFMRKTGLVFGCFDFIVTPEGDYVFLEVNEQGQFLWIEEYNPEIKMLDIFVNFLVNRKEKFHWDSDGYEHAIEHYRKNIDPVFSENMLRHVELNSAKANSQQGV